MSGIGREACPVRRFAVSNPCRRTFAPGQKVCPESTRNSRRARHGRRSNVPDLWNEHTTMPQMPRSDEEERNHQRRKDQMAVQGPLVRGVRVTRVRPQVRGPARRSGLAVLQGEPGGAPHPGQEPEAREPADVGFVAARAAGPDHARRGAPRRHPPAPRRGRAHRGLRRPRGRMARGEERDGRGLVVATVQDRAAAGGGVRRRGRRAQGAARCLAVHPGAALHVPRVHEHHRADPGSGRASRPADASGRSRSRCRASRTPRRPPSG